MSLIACPDCKKECSSEALSCPNCGKPFRQTSLMTKNLGTVAGIYSLILGIGIILALFDNTFFIGAFLAIAGGLLLTVRIIIWAGTIMKK
jgi:hypothetical protein